MACVLSVQYCVTLIDMHQSKRSAERLVQQGLLQGVEGGELALVEGFEALGFFVKDVELCGQLFLLLHTG
jgi:hypothetical protein